jgi:hypothetical protein
VRNNAHVGVISLPAVTTFLPAALAKYSQALVQAMLDTFLGVPLEDVEKRIDHELQSNKLSIYPNFCHFLLSLPYHLGSRLDSEFSIGVLRSFRTIANTRKSRKFDSYNSHSFCSFCQGSVSDRSPFEGRPPASFPLRMSPLPTSQQILLIIYSNPQLYHGK